MTLVIDAAPLVALADEREPRRDEILEIHADLNLGLADLSVAVLAGRLGTRRILTFDQRHFRALRPIQGGAFTLAAGRSMSHSSQADPRGTP